MPTAAGPLTLAAAAAALPNIDITNMFRASPALDESLYPDPNNRPKSPTKNANQATTMVFPATKVLCFLWLVGLVPSSGQHALQEIHKHRVTSMSNLGYNSGWGGRKTYAYYQGVS